MRSTCHRVPEIDLAETRGRIVRGPVRVHEQATPKPRRVAMKTIRFPRGPHLGRYPDPTSLSFRPSNPTLECRNRSGTPVAGRSGTTKDAHRSRRRGGGQFRPPEPRRSAACRPGTAGHGSHDGELGAVARGDGIEVTGPRAPGSSSGMRRYPDTYSMERAPSQPVKAINLPSGERESHCTGGFGRATNDAPPLQVDRVDDGTPEVPRAVVANAIFPVGELVGAVLTAKGSGKGGQCHHQQGDSDRRGVRRYVRARKDSATVLQGNRCA